MQGYRESGNTTTQQPAHLRRGLEDPSLFLLERNAQLEQLDKCLREFLEERVAVLGIALDVLPELLVLDEGNVGREHHQGLGGVVGVLGRTVPLLPMLAFTHSDLGRWKDVWHSPSSTTTSPQPAV